MRFRDLHMITLTVRWSKHMSNQSKFLTRVGQGLLAIAATGATVLVLQIAMLA